MRTFLRKTAIALLIAALFHVAAGFLADGTTDGSYLRFTTSKQRSMILGGSRAAQGLHPSVFNDRAYAGSFDGPLYDFAFTLAHSPYGATYLHAINEKLDTSARNGLFILQVDPWLLSNTSDTLIEPEADRTLGKQLTWNARPNYEYLLRYWDRGWGALGHWPMGDPDTTTEVMPDGRLALHVPMERDTVLKRTQRRTLTYRDEYLPNRRLSLMRLDYLRRTIGLLSPHGAVVLVRLPVGRAIGNMEDAFAPEFNYLIGQLAASTGAAFINLDTLPATFTDGNHLDEASGLRVTEALRNAILGPPDHRSPARTTIGIVPTPGAASPPQTTFALLFKKPCLLSPNSVSVPRSSARSPSSAS